MAWLKGLPGLGPAKMPLSLENCRIALLVTQNGHPFGEDRTADFAKRTLSRYTADPARQVVKTDVGLIVFLNKVRSRYLSD